jgi:DNA-3-methyladenine glycosylase
MLCTPLPRSFYDRDVLEVAPALLGQRLVHLLDGVRVAGIITETEAYRGSEDLACHARHGCTARNAVMFGPPGHAYIYFTYGMHWCLNAVCDRVGFPAAVLIRALQPCEGLEQIAARRPNLPAAQWTNGPAKLTRALAITGALNGIDLCDPHSALWIEPGITPQSWHSGPRIGISYAPEPWRSIPWRFWL